MGASKASVLYIYIDNIDNSRHGTRSKFHNFIPLTFMFNPLVVRTKEFKYSTNIF